MFYQVTHLLFEVKYERQGLDEYEKSGSTWRRIRWHERAA